MGDVTVKHIDELSCYEGEYKQEGMRFCYAGKDLGVRAWGMNVIKMGPQCKEYPNHDHEADGQEEVYVILEGRATIHAGDTQLVLNQGMMVRVGPSQKRVFTTEDEGATILAIGGTPGQPYRART